MYFQRLTLEFGLELRVSASNRCVVRTKKFIGLLHEPKAYIS